MKIIILLFFNLYLFAAKPIVDLNGIYLYDAIEVLQYKNQQDIRKKIVIFSSSKCSHCVTYKKKLFNIDTNTKKYFNNNYVFAIAEDNYNLANSFNVTSTPTTMIFNNNNNLVVQPMVGEPINIDEFISYLISISKI